MRAKDCRLMISSHQSSGKKEYIALMSGTQSTPLDVELDIWRDEAQVETACIWFRGMSRAVVVRLLEDAARALRKAK